MNNACWSFAALLVLLFCSWTVLPAEEFNNRWPAKKQYADPAITAAMEAVRAAIPQAAADPTRPVYHFRPPARWMNDPCGVIYHKGYYHVFYQLNPTGSTWGVDNTHWGHTRSRDLVNWEHLPVALCPSRDRGERRCNSGCVTINGRGRPMIFYTFVPQDNSQSRQQWAAIGDDDLINWKKHPDNPIIGRKKASIPATVGRSWSDPFVFRAGGKTLVTFKESGGTICLALNEELDQWKYAGSMADIPGECPNFVKLGGKWLLITSAGNSSRQLQYQIGRFDSERMKFTKEKTGILDHSYGPKTSLDKRGLYATNTLFDPQGRCIMFGWISGFKGDCGWNGCLGLPRIITLGSDGRPRQAPVPELKMLRGKHTQAKAIMLDDRARVVEDARGDTLEIVARFRPGDAKAYGLKVRRSADGRKAVAFSYDGSTLDAAGTRIPLKLGPGETLDLRVFLDRSVMEAFINGGRECVARVIHPGEEDLGMEVFAQGGTATVESLDVWQMKSVWTE